MMNNNLQKYQMIYYARIMPSCNMYELLDLKIRTIADNYFTGTNERDKQTFLFSYNDINKIVFLSRSDALEFVKFKESKYKND